MEVFLYNIGYRKVKYHYCLLVKFRIAKIAINLNRIEFFFLKLINIDVYMEKLTHQQNSQCLEYIAQDGGTHLKEKLRIK